ncbi:MAG TPA: phosphoribosylamine--glycine ligase [Ignavibacteriaceae bacterium]|nr:phosphoribosylamine--glycine ligase [Ignavibacteriaceae bacterium]
MIVLLIGSGGREHALAYKIKQSSLLTKLYMAPGNPGTKKLGENIKLDISKHNGVIDFCLENKVELVVVGPEIPLVNGLANELRKNKILVFGPNKEAADIEGHKTFAKDLMKTYNIPSAGYQKYSSYEFNKANDYLLKCKYPVVLKADGLAAGKGVIICKDKDEAIKSLNEIFIEKIFGDAGNKLVIEEFMYGEEASIFAITDGTDFICLPSAQDHKRIGDNDTGKNTGGMGAYSPAPMVTDEILSQVRTTIIEPVLKALREENRTFVGCLYCGLMLTEEGPKVVEFNCRFGDPETQAVLPLIEGDFLNLLYTAAKGKLDAPDIKYSGGSSVCVIAASKGYPDEYKIGYEIKALDELKDVLCFFSGVKEDSSGKLITSGGRVLCITAVLKELNIKEAKDIAYKELSKISFENIYYRKDISDKAYINFY